MTIGDLLDLDATAQAEQIRAGAVSPSELVDAAIDRVERTNGALNAVIHQQFERARREAAGGREGAPPTGPFAGVPFLFKDYGAEETGEPLCAGLGVARDLDHRGTSDSRVAVAFRAAGFLPIGRTNVPQLACMGTTEPVAFGPTHNPWAPGRSPGGSSGGAAAAVSARVVPVAHANDIAGSIRIPAAHCGLVGLKATRFRVISDGVPPPVGMFTEGVVTRSVRDTAATIDALSNPSGSAWWAPAAMSTTLADAVGLRPRGLRIGLTTTAFNEAEVDAECVEAAESAGHLLESLGHAVEAAAPDALFDPSLQEAMKDALAATTAADVCVWSRRLGRPLGEDDLEASSWNLVQRAERLGAVGLVTAMECMEDASRRAAAWWADDGFDLLVTPTTAEGPTVLGELQSRHQPGRSSAFTRVVNATGNPAISLPLGWTDDGVPRGVQLVAAHGREDLLISVAAALEEAAPWADRRPPSP